MHLYCSVAQDFLVVCIKDGHTHKTLHKFVNLLVLHAFNILKSLKLSILLPISQCS